jgi:hypothetical protein
MRYNGDVYETKPFRINNQWIDHGDFKSLVKGYWRDSNAMDIEGENLGPSKKEVELRKRQFGELWHLLKSKESLMFQRARSICLKEGSMHQLLLFSYPYEIGKKRT